MKQLKIICVAVMAIAVLAATSVQARELIYGSWVSPKHGVMVDALPILFKGVFKDTNGAVKWKLVAGGQLVKGKNTLAGIRDGLIDAGLTISVYTVKNTPSNALIHSTLIFGNDVVAATGAYMETVLLNCPTCIEEHHRNNAVFLTGYATTPFKLMCRKKVQTVADLKGKKVRAIGGGATLMKMAGAVPVSISPAQATTALQRGTIDCVLGAVAWLKSYGYQDVAKHILDFPLGIIGPPGSMTVNRKIWNGFTDDQKRAHVKYLPDVVAHSAISAYIKRDEAIFADAKGNGVTVYKAGQDFIDLAKKMEDSQRARLAKRAKTWGLKNPEAIQAAMEKALAKWQKLSLAIGHDVEKFKVALKREVYDKIDINKL